jgi:integrase
MPPKLPSYVDAFRSKGRTYYYFRHKGARQKLPGSPDTPEFWTEYARLLDQHKNDPTPRLVADWTVGALIRDYKRSSEYLDLAEKTRVDYARMLDRLAPIEAFAAADIRRRHIRQLREKLADKPRAQKLFTQVASLLWNFAINNDYAEVNPASRMKRSGAARAYAPWSEEDCKAFEDSKPPTTFLTAYMLARYAGQREGDILKMTRKSYADGAIEVVQDKTGEPVWIPAHAVLKAYLDALPCDALLFVTRFDGAAWKATTFSKSFHAWLREHGIKRHFHGLRHTAGKALAEAGCSEKEIQAILGHRTTTMVAHYTRAARQKRLASAAIAKLERTGTEHETAKPKK